MGEIFKALQNLEVEYVLLGSNFKVRGDGQYFTSECINSSIALAFTSLNFDESHKLH